MVIPMITRLIGCLFTYELKATPAMKNWIMASASVDLAVSLKDVQFSYRAGKKILDIPQLEIAAGERVPAVELLERTVKIAHTSVYTRSVADYVVRATGGR